MRKTRLSLLLTLLLLLLGTGLASAQAMDPTTLKARSGADFDLYFMRNIITNHQIDVELLRPAATNAQHAEIKTLALSLMGKREQEADQLIGWLNDWYHNQPDTSITTTLVHMKAMPSMDMGSLNEALHQIYDLQVAKGDEYDRKALLYLIRDHQLAIEAASLVPTRAARTELKPFAQSLITEEQAEIDQFTAWLGQWYQVDATGKSLTAATATNPSVPPTSPPAVAATVQPTPISVANPTATAIPPTRTSLALTATATAMPLSPTPAAQASATSSVPAIAPTAASSAATPTSLPAANPPASNSSNGLVIVVIGAIVLLAGAGLATLLRRRSLT